MCSRTKEVSYQERITCTDISMLFPLIVNYIRMYNIESITFFNNVGSRATSQSQNCQKNLFSNKKERKCFNLPDLGDISKIRNENLISNKCIALSSIILRILVQRYLLVVPFVDHEMTPLFSPLRFFFFF